MKPVLVIFWTGKMPMDVFKAFTESVKDKDFQIVLVENSKRDYAQMFCLPENAVPDNWQNVVQQIRAEYAD